jgi:hypothetical protein
MVTNYSFSYDTGDEQKQLHYVMRAVVVEVLLFGFTEKAWVLPTQTIVILVTPLVIYSNRELPYFLDCIFAKMCIQYLLILCLCINIPYDSALMVAQNIGIVQVFMIYFLHYVQYVRDMRQYMHVDPYSQYAISREIIHAALITESAAEAAEGDES